MSPSIIEFVKSRNTRHDDEKKGRYVRVGEDLRVPMGLERSRCWNRAVYASCRQMSEMDMSF